MLIRQKLFALFRDPAYLPERSLTILIAVLNPVLLVVERLITPSLLEYPYVRLILSLISLSIFVGSYLTPFIRKYFTDITYLLIYAFVAHIVALTYLNQFIFYYCSLLLSLVIASAFYFQSKKQLLIFQVSMLVLILQASVLSVNTTVNIWMFLSFYVVLNILVYFIQTAVIRQNNELKKVAKQLELTAKNLEKTNKSLEQFAYIASHDLQEPLRTVNSYMQLLQKRYGHRLDGDADEFIRFSTDAVRRMQNLIHGLLKYSRAGSEQMERTAVDLNEVVGSVLDNMDASIKENAAEVNVGHLPQLHGDKIQLSQLFQNLISNAIKYRRSDKPVISIHHIQNGEQCLISVEDNGIGIPEKYRENVFKIFNRVNATSNVDGVGIGLAVCKKIVTNHNGEMWVESEVGRGSTFYFTLAMN